MARKIAFITDQFEIGRPSQQLLDRFLLGYPWDGKHHQMDLDQVLIVETSKEIDSKDWQEWRSSNPLYKKVDLRDEAIKSADGIIILGSFDEANFVSSIIGNLKARHHVFVVGDLNRSFSEAKKLADKIREIGCAFSIGSIWSALNSFPEQALPVLDSQGNELITHNDDFPPTLTIGTALDGLSRVSSSPWSEIEKVNLFKNVDVVKLVDDRNSPVRKLADAAFSRSHSPLGHGLVDSRSENLLELKRYSFLCDSPYLVQLKHQGKAGKSRYILGTKGVMRDINFAVTSSKGEVHSGQLFLPPKPAEHGYSLLAKRIEDFIEGKDDFVSLDDVLKRSWIVGEIRKKWKNRGGFR